MSKILVVDDEDTLCEGLRYNLEAEGYDVQTAGSAEEAMELDLAGFDLILLDVMMGQMSGFKLARQLKADSATAHVPIIFLTARNGEDDMIAGLTIGADDYISKPFSVRNVLARVRTVLRRTQPHSTLRYQGLTVDHTNMKCMVDGTEVNMPRKEFEILSLLLSQPGRVFTRQEMLSRAWPSGVVVSERTIDVNITRLRQKLGQYSSKITTRPGYGYCFEP